MMYHLIPPVKKTVPIVALLIAVVFAIAFSGCENNTQPSKVEQAKGRALEVLPPNTTIVEDLGNKWYIVEIKKKKFLFGYWGEQGFTITELKSEFLPHLEDD